MAAQESRRVATGEVIAIRPTISVKDQVVELAFLLEGALRVESVYTERCFPQSGARDTAWPKRRTVLGKPGGSALMQPAFDSKHNALVQRIRSVRAALQGVADPDTRNTLLDQLGAATRELAELILKKEGWLKSPLE